MGDLKDIIEKYKSKFSEKKLFCLITKNAGRVGMKSIYTGLLLFFAFRRKETPSWAKNIILGTLGYFVSPIDAIPDLTPLLGYTDDLGILSFGLVTIASYVDDGVRKKAREKLTRWFPSADQSGLIEVDNKI